MPPLDLTTVAGAPPTVELLATAGTTDELAGPLRRRRRRVGPGLMIGGAWIILVFAAAVLADVLPLQDPLTTDPAATRDGPSAQHWLGADQLGRDQLARLIHGGRVSLLVGFSATAISCTLGMLLACSPATAGAPRRR